MNGYIKYFDNGGKNMTFVTDNEKVYDKYNEIWEVTRKLLKVKFAANPVRDDKYLIARLKIFNKIYLIEYIYILLYLIEQHLIIKIIFL